MYGLDDDIEKRVLVLGQKLDTILAESGESIAICCASMLALVAYKNRDIDPELSVVLTQIALHFSEVQRKE